MSQPLLLRADRRPAHFRASASFRLLCVSAGCFLFLALATLGFTLRFADTKQLRFLVLSGLTFFLAHLAKENALTFLAVIPLTLYYFRQCRPGRP